MNVTTSSSTGLDKLKAVFFLGLSCNLTTFTVCAITWIVMAKNGWVSGIWQTALTVLAFIPVFMADAIDNYVLGRIRLEHEKGWDDVQISVHGRQKVARYYQFFRILSIIPAYLLAAVMIASYSGAMIAANAAANTISTYISVPANAINLVTITVISQCVGAGRGQEAKRISKLLQLGTIASLVITGSLVALFMGPIVGMLKLGTEAHQITRNLMFVYCAVAVILHTPAFGLPNTLRAAGDNRYVMYAAVVSVVVFRLLGSYVLGNLMNLQVYGIWYAMYLDWLGRSVFFLWRFKGNKWLEHRLV